MPNNSFDLQLTEVLINSHERSKTGDTIFSTKLFFEEYFRKRGNPYFFLFKKNLKVTNIQLGELLNLMQAHFKATGPRSPMGLQFITTSEFKTSVEHLLIAFRGKSDDLEERCRQFSVIYGDLFRRFVVVDAFFGSCAVFTPPGISLDLATICERSGYVHSCGHNVFTRKAYKTKKGELYGALTRYLDKHLARSKQAFFAVYSHEDFTEFDRTWANELLDGLDNVKIFVEKYYMGSEPLVAVLQEMKKQFRDRLVIPDAGNFRRTHTRHRRDRSIDRDQTLWLLVDRSTTDRPRQAGEIKYFICYAQLYKNDNPFHFFDENKPAWLSHTTIPHTLMGAMINLTLPWPKRGKVAVADPFVGSGTSWLELIKYPNVVCACGDIEPLAPLLAQDNLHFFAAEPDEIKVYIDALEFICKPQKRLHLASPKELGKRQAGFDKAYQWALEAFENIPHASDRRGRAAALRLSADSDPLKRLFLYLALRTNIRHNLGFARLSGQQREKEWEVAYTKEAEKLLTSMIGLHRVRASGPGDESEDGRFTRSDGTYSKGTTLSHALLKKINGSGVVSKLVKCRDALRLKENTFDIIVTDPPYGFNQGGEDERKLAQFYARIMEILVLALKRKGGQLVFAVPDWSYTGKTLPYFTFQEVVTKQVLAAAEKHQRQVYIPGIAIPSNHFKPPYYWESERALRRVILQFRLRVSDS